MSFIIGALRGGGYVKTSCENNTLPITAKVQCALRGATFCKSVRAMYALIVCNGIQKLVQSVFYFLVVCCPLLYFMADLLGDTLALSFQVHNR